MKTYPHSDGSLHTVEEAAVAYTRSTVPGYSFSGSFKDFFRDKLMLVAAVRKGVTIAFFEAIFRNAPFTEKQWADVLNISQKSLQRYRATEGYRFKPIHSEKVLQVAEAIEVGRSVFDTQAQLYLWLESPCYALGGATPVELLMHAHGHELVMDELNRIEHGIFA